MAGLFDPLSSLPTYEPPAAAHNGAIAESNFADMSMLGPLPPTSFVLDDFTSMYEAMGQSSFDMRGNLNYDLGDNWGTLDVQALAGSKPDGNVLGQDAAQYPADPFAMVNAGPLGILAAHPLSFEQFAGLEGNTAPGNAAPAA